MAEFLVKRGGPKAVTVSVTAPKGLVASVKFPVGNVGAQRRVSVPDRHADKIDPKHAGHLVRLAGAPQAFASESVTIAAGPQGKRKRRESVTG